MVSTDLCLVCLHLNFSGMVVGLCHIYADPPFTPSHPTVTTL